MERIAILPIENLAADQSSAWMSPVIARLTVASLAGVPSLYAWTASDTNEAFLRRPSSLVHSYLTREKGRWRLHSVIRDRSGKTQRAVTVIEQDAVALATSLGRELSPQAQAPQPRNPEALRLFGLALFRPEDPQSEAWLTQAVGLDPGFADAQWILAQRTGRQPAVPASIKLDAIDQARLALAASRTPEDRLAAAMRMQALLPADADAALLVSTLFLQRRDYGRSVEYRLKALASDPDAPELWNHLAFAQAYAGDLNSSVASIGEYAKRRAGGNPQDSLGEIYFLHGKFAEAEKAFLAAYDSQPGFLGSATLRKAAESRRMAGQQAEADRLFQRYADSLSQSPLRVPEQALWDYTSGRMDAGIQRLRQFAQQSNLPLAWAILAVWERAQTAGAGAESAARAAKLAAAPGDKLPAALAMLVTQPPATAEQWSQRVDRVFQGNAAGRARSAALAWALLLDHHYAEALPLLRTLYQEGPPVGFNEWLIPLVWVASDLGKKEEVRALTRYWPIPASTPSGLFSCFGSNPRLFRKP